MEAISPGTLAPEARARIRRDLVALLADRPGSKAVHLAREIGIPKTLCNRVLYADSGSFEHNDGSPRLWYLRNGGRGVAVAPVTPSAFDSGEGAERPQPSDGEAPETTFDLYEWQDEALTAWSEAGWQGIVEAVTGAGKTMIGVAAIVEHLEVLDGAGRAVVIVPTIDLLEQWYTELIERLPARFSIGRMGAGHRDSLERADVLIAVVNTARGKKIGLPDDCRGLLVADECHRLASVQNKNVLNDDFVDRLGLSATYERPDGAHESVLIPYFGKVVYSLDYRDAMAAGVIAPVRVATIGVDLSSRERAAYDEAAEYASRARSAMVNKYGAPADPFGEYVAWVSHACGGPRGDLQRLARRYMKFWQAKRQVLAETPAKLSVLDRMVPAIEDADRTLVFTSTIDSTESIVAILRGHGIDAAAHHSHLDKTTRDQVLDRFRRGDLRVIVTAMTLNEGIDVPEADLAVVLAASRQRREMIQRMGRVLRRKADGRDARFVVVYARDTPEDPARGAHEAFFDSLVEVAHSVQDFGPQAPARELARFLAP